jgi:hypothetical protein
MPNIAPSAMHDPPAFMVAESKYVSGTSEPSQNSVPFFTPSPQNAPDEMTLRQVIEQAVHVEPYDELQEPPFWVPRSHSSVCGFKAASPQTLTLHKCVQASVSF